MKTAYLMRSCLGHWSPRVESSTLGATDGVKLKGAEEISSIVCKYYEVDQKVKIVILP